MSKILLTILLTVASVQVVAMSNVTWVICTIEGGGIGHSNSKGDASFLFRIGKCEKADMPQVYEDKWVKLSPSQAVLGKKIIRLALKGDGKVKLAVLNTSKMDDVLLVDALYVESGVGKIVAAGPATVARTIKPASTKPAPTTKPAPSGSSSGIKCNPGDKLEGGKCLPSCGNILTEKGITDTANRCNTTIPYTCTAATKTYDCNVCCTGKVINWKSDNVNNLGDGDGQGNNTGVGGSSGPGEGPGSNGNENPGSGFN